MDKAHRGNTVSKGNGYQAVIEVPTLSEMLGVPHAESMRKDGYMTASEIAAAWGVPRTTAHCQLDRLVRMGKADESTALSFGKVTKVWKFKKP